MSTPNPFDPGLFRPESVSAETAAFNRALGDRLANVPKWWEDPTAMSRIFPPPVLSPRARNDAFETKDGRKIGLRVLAPPSPTGIYLHIHGGGLVLGTADGQDQMLERIADSTGLVCVSVEYRLAPAHPWPAAWDDCEAAAMWLAERGKSELGVELVAIGGESAGATLAVPTMVRMRDKHGFAFRAANLTFGNYDTSMTPSQRIIGRSSVLLQTVDIEHCSDAYAPDVSRRRDPDLSALYAELQGLGPALFTVGTGDPFLDDSLFVYARWIAAGNEAELAVYPGGVHGFTMFPIPIAEQANRRIDAFLKRHSSA
ncbi:MAG TPA: alpha/beta hydrolase [Stellaceae bacterium]|nr:alpha/beta hydrolase [Stellaceae bacterium]